MLTHGNDNLRLYNLRVLNGLNQTEFARMLDITQPQLSQFEQGTRQLPAKYKDAARFRFKLPHDYFDQPAITYGQSSLNYRRRKLATKHVLIATMTFGFIEQEMRKDAPLNQLDGLELTRAHKRRDLETIEHAAAMTRELIGIAPHKPINNVTRCMDKLGIIIAPLVNPHLPQGKIDGISTPLRSHQPFVTTLNYDVPGDRFRFSASHELGHIMLHGDGHDGSLMDRESEADTFASSFLLPRAPLLDELTSTLTLTGYAKLKAKWGVSIQAIVRRAKDLNVITPERYRSLMMQISGRGWRKNEPVHVPVEAPLNHTPRLAIFMPENPTPTNVPQIHPTETTKKTPNEPPSPKLATISHLPKK